MAKNIKDELNRSDYSVLQNIGYCIKNTAECQFSLLSWCAVLVMINVALSVLTTYLPKVVIEKITEEKTLYDIVVTTLLFTGCIALLSGGKRFFAKYVYHQKLKMNTFYLRYAAHKGLTTDYCNQENGTFRKLQTEGFSCCNGHYSTLTHIYDILINLCTSILGVSVFTAILVRLNWVLILFLIVTTVVSYFLNQKIVDWIAENSRERIGYQQRLNYINSVSENICSAKDIRLYRMAGWFSDIYMDNMNGIAGWYKRLTGKVFGVSVCDSGFALLREGVVYIYLLYLIWHEQINVADFILYFGVVTGFSTWLSNILSQAASLNRINLKINYFRSYLEYPECYQREEGIKPLSDLIPKTIELKNVCYKYEGAEEFTLHNINLKIDAGEHIAIVGLNGAGKTTLVKLICGLTDPTEGQVLYDGVDVREYNRSNFYKLFSVVFQQYSILPVTIEEIVAETPTENVNHQRVKDCLITAGLWNKIERLPKGVKSEFGKIIYDDGVELSGGEVQKLLLARALYKSSPVMILDEPTAALDPIAESVLYENYNRISERKTTVFISHRLASTRFCDRIILMENGEICEEGNHKSLLALGGKYNSLFEMQAKYYRDQTIDGEVAG